MPEITVIHIALIVVALIAGLVVGWLFRSGRSVGEKTAINLGWQEQLETQRNEHERLSDQNKSLMEQNSQYQASHKDSKMRASELSGALKEAFERRDELQRQIKDIRNNLESTVVERDQLQNDMESREVEDDVTSTVLQQRDAKITKLQKDLDNWQERVPLVIERFRTRNKEADQLELDLAEAHERIAGLEAILGSDQTRVEPVDPDALGNDLSASNDADDIEELEELEDVEKPTAEEAPGDDLDRDVRDNLKRIKGVGPAIEKTLHELGIFRFTQIADMSEYDIDRVARRLKGFRSRIYREDWTGQARDLLNQNVSGLA